VDLDKSAGVNAYWPKESPESWTIRRKVASFGKKEFLDILMRAEEGNGVRVDGPGISQANNGNLRQGIGFKTIKGSLFRLRGGCRKKNLRGDVVRENPTERSHASVQ